MKQMNLFIDPHIPSANRERIPFGICSRKGDLRNRSIPKYTLSSRLSSKGGVFPKMASA